MTQTNRAANTAAGLQEAQVEELRRTEAEKRLAALPEEDRQLVERVMKHHPLLTLHEALEALDEFGGL
jgi:hypothetical protein